MHRSRSRKSVHEYFADEHNRAIVEKLRAAALNFSAPTNAGTLLDQTLNRQVGGHHGTWPVLTARRPKPRSRPARECDRQCFEEHVAVVLGERRGEQGDEGRAVGHR